MSYVYYPFKLCHSLEEFWVGNSICSASESFSSEFSRLATVCLSRC